MIEPSAEALLEHAGFLRALARSLLFDEGQAEDVVQETYVAALRRPPPRSGARGWLAAVARNLALKRRRTEARLRLREAQAARAGAHAATDDVVGRLELHRLLVDAVQRLDEPYRAAIVHRYFEDLPPREIARELGMPVRAIETRLRRAVERLRGDLDASHGGDRLAWSLPLLALLPLPRGGAIATLAGAIMSKTHFFVAAAIAALCFVAGWSLRPKDERPARAARETAAAAAPVPDPETARLRRELEAERALRIEAEGKLRAAAAAAEEGGAGGTEAAAEVRKGPRFRFPEFEAVFAEIDWAAAGESMANLAPLLAELLESIERTGELPPNVGEVQRWNGPLVSVALKLAQAGVPGTGTNGSFTHPAVEANLIHATLTAGGKRLTTEQEARLDEIGRRFSAEEARRIGAYPDGTLRLRQLVEEAALKDRFYAEVDELLTEEQRDALHPESVRGFTQVDLFSSGLVTYLHARPVDFKDREAAVKRVADRHFETLGLDPAARPAVEQLVRRWAERVAEAGLDAPREKDVDHMPALTRADRVRRAAQLQLELWEDLQRRVPMTDEQKRALAGETNILVPFR